MFKKLFRPVNIGSATAIIATTSFFSYAIGLVRDRVIAVNFGTTTATDTYNASFLIPDMLFNLFIAGALMAAFMPVFTEYLEKDKEQARRIANTVLTGATILITVLAVLAFIFMDHLIPFFFTDIELSAKKDIINMTRLMLPSAILFAISNTLGNILMSFKHFIAYSFSPILYNVGIILGVVFLSENFGIYSASIGVLIGAFFHALIRIIDTLFTGYKYRPQLQVSHPAFKKIIKLMIPKAISLISWQINLYIFALVGIRLIEGGLAAFNFARNIQSFAVSLFGISFATAVFPYLTAATGKKDQKSYTDHVEKTIERILFFTIPSMVGVMLLAKPLVELILSGGIFNEDSVKLTSLILFFFAFSIPLESLSHIFSRAFYARQNTFTPMLINLTTMAFIAFCSFFVAPKYGIEWFSLGFSLGFLLYNILIITALKKYLAGFNFKNFLLSISKTILSSGIMAAVILESSFIQDFMSIKIAYILQIFIGVIVFFLASYFLKSPEMASIKYILQRISRKKEYEAN